MASSLLNVAARDAHYAVSGRSGTTLNAARYLVDLHNAKATFNFCGGMLFQLVLTDALKAHLVEVAKQQEASAASVTIFEKMYRRMASVPGYDKSAHADNLNIFHGREIRKVPDAEGGMGFVLQLSLAGAAGGPTSARDPQGWTPQEVAGYDGWGHDGGRQWRKGPHLVSEGYETFQKEFGNQAFALHHRFYLHFDDRRRLWLAAEDGCEGCVPH